MAPGQKEALLQNLLPMADLTVAELLLEEMLHEDLIVVLETLIQACI